VWTRGYGETEGIRASSPAITRAQGERNLAARLARYYEPSIARLGVALNQNQWDALCSFTWNLGAGIFTGELRIALTRREWGRAAQLMLAYDHAGGVVLEGLRRRRQAEAALFLRAAPASVPADERRWIREYDELRGRHAPWALVRLRVLRRYMTARRRQIWQLAKHQANGWQRLNRKARYDALLARTR
jgi:lysozyme